MLPFQHLSYRGYKDAGWDKYDGIDDGVGVDRVDAVDRVDRTNGIDRGGRQALTSRAF